MENRPVKLTDQLLEAAELISKKQQQEKSINIILKEISDIIENPFQKHIIRMLINRMESEDIVELTAKQLYDPILCVYADFIEESAKSNNDFMISVLEEKLDGVLRNISETLVNTELFLLAKQSQ